MAFPKYIPVLGEKIKVKVSQETDNEGEYKPQLSSITINPGYPVPQQAKTLFHETLHAILDKSGVAYILEEKLEEATVRAIENGIWPLIELFTELKKQD